MAIAKEVVATGFIVFRRLQNQIQYLLLQASNGEFHWSPPKGRVEPRETEVEAAFRETEEESGLRQTDLSVIKGFEYVLRYTAWGKPKRVVYWLAELKNPSATVTISREHKDFKWLDIQTAVELAKYEDLRETLREANSYLQTHS